MISNNQKIICLSILISFFTPWAHAELYTAIVEMEPLLKTQKRIIDDLDAYITKEEERLAVLKDLLERFKVEHEQAMEDIPNYLGNPINAFTLIKRLTTDLDEIDTYIKKGTVAMVTLEYIGNVSMMHGDLMFPTQEDLAGAVQGLTRLQITYKLDVHDLAEGRLNGIAYSYPLTAADCFEFCRDLYYKKDYKNSLPWSIESLRKHKEETNKKHYFTEVDLLEYIAYTHYLMGDLTTALQWTKELLKLEPNHPQAVENAPQYVESIARDASASKKRGESKDKPDDAKIKTGKLIDDVSNYPEVKQRYEALCRGEVEINSDVTKRLFCRYMSENHPFLRLAPIKAEQVYIDPDVFVFHGVLSDDEIQGIKDLSTPRLKRAVIQDPGTGEQRVANYRISKSAWLRDEESPVVSRVSQRVADMTGLSMVSAEELQVVNYGIGGQYEPHFDFSRKGEKVFSEHEGNRIATLLYYMSDVVQGGATVFTNLGLAVFPERGKALLFLNLHPSGEGDMATRHAACPVLRGSKWVCNKWLHEAGQELIKPCNLEYQREEMIREIPQVLLKSYL